jgi:hypothetical protein
MSWIKGYPKTVSKNDLRGRKLTVIADSPPIPSNKSGIMQLKVFEPSSNQNFIVLVTGQDINKIITLIEANKQFTFDKSEPWAEVIEA